jgi:DNA polymerase (family 10)
MSSGGKEGGSIKIAMTLKEATEWAWKIQMILDLKKIDSEICGSIRRMKPDGIGDIDMVVRRPVYDAVYAVVSRKLDFVFHGKNLTKETKQAAFTVKDIPFNFYGADENSWGAMVLFLTGSQLFNIIMRGEAKKQGYKLNQHGLWLGDDQIAGKTEKQMFDALGLEWVKPEDRSIDNSNKKVLRPLREKK